MFENPGFIEIAVYVGEEGTKYLRELHNEMFQNL